MRNTSEVSDGPTTPRPTSSATPAIDAIDHLWQEHLSGINSPRNSIGLTAYGQRDPLIEYKAQAFKLFDALMVNIQSEICHSLFRCALSRMASKQFLHNRPQTPADETAAPFQDPASLAESSNVLTQAQEGLAKAQPVCKDTRRQTQRPLPLRQRQEVRGVRPLRHPLAPRRNS